MASKNPDAAEYDADVLEAAKQLVADRKRREASIKNPWWVCSSCSFVNHPRATHPGHTKCEQCGKERDEADITLTGQQAAQNLRGGNA